MSRARAFTFSGGWKERRNNESTCEGRGSIGGNRNYMTGGYMLDQLPISCLPCFYASTNKRQLWCNVTRNGKLTTHSSGTYRDTCPLFCPANTRHVINYMRLTSKGIVAKKRGRALCRARAWNLGFTFLLGN